MLKKLGLGFFIGVAILAIDAAIPLLLAHRVTTIRAEANVANATRDSLHDLLSAYKDTETGQRGFMLTGKQEFLEPYTSGRATVETLLPRLQTQLQNDPQQAARFAELLELDRRDARFLQERIAERNDSNWFNLDASQNGKMLMDGLRAKIADLSAAERTRGDVLLQRVTQLQRWSLLSLIAITALDLILFAFIFFVMARSLRAERTAINALTDLNKNLAQEISLRTETMARLSQQSNRLNQIVQMQTVLAEAQLDIDAFMQEIVQRMLAITPATGAAIEMIEGDEMVYVTASGAIAQFVGLRLPSSVSLSGLCVDKAEVMIAADTSTDPRVDRAACVKVGAAAMIVAPLLRAGEPVGVLKIVSDTAHAFDDSAVQTLRLMAGFLGAALGNQLQFQKNKSLLTERSITLRALKRELQRREESEQKLSTQQETLHALTNAIPALIAFIDADGYLRYCNDECARVCGMTVEDIVDRNLQAFMGNELYCESKPYIDSALAGKSAIYERTVATAVGLRHQESRLIPQFDANGKPDGFYLIAWDITERKTQEIEWQSRASIDPLTGLLNRAFFTEALNLALPRHQRMAAGIAVLYLDIDRFKQINDTYGHAAGDALLKAFANYLKQSVRHSDVVGRFGGDEFCIVLDDIQTPANTIAVAEKILAAVRTPVLFENRALTISTSIGIAFAQQPQLSSTELIALADTALYQAKQAGRNRYALDIISAEQAETAHY